MPGCFPDFCGLFCVPGTIACQTLDFFIRFRSDVWPGQRDGRRLFRYGVPGCFPDLKDVLCVPGTIACQTRDFFIPFRSDVWPQEAVSSPWQRDGRSVLWLVLCAWNNCLPRPLNFSFGSGVTFGPGRGTAGGCFVTPCQGVFLI